MDALVHPRPHRIRVSPTVRIWPVSRRAILLLTLSLLAPACHKNPPVPGPTPCSPAYGEFKAGNWPPGCWRPYADSSPFNKPVPESPALVSNSAQIVSRVLGDISSVDKPNNLVANKPLGNTGEPTYYSEATDPLFTLHCKDDPFSRPDGTCDELEGLRIRIPAGARREGGASASANNDRHMTIIDQTSGWEYDLWQVKEVRIPGASQPVPISSLPNDGGLPKEGGDLYFSWGGRAKVKDGDGLAYNQNLPAGKLPGDATAAHFASLAGRLRVEELEAGEINHALFIVINCDSGGPPVFPAQAKGQPCSKIGLPNVDAPPMGSRFQLNMSQEEIGQLSEPQFPAWKKTILRAAAKYGMFFGDTGANGYFTIETEAGNQYTSVGNPGQYDDKWVKFAQSNNWSFFAPDQNYVGDLSGVTSDELGEDIWERLRVIHPCVSEGTC
jgi:hypothetical protein